MNKSQAFKVPTLAWFRERPDSEPDRNLSNLFQVFPDFNLILFLMKGGYTLRVVIMVRTNDQRDSSSVYTFLFYCFVPRNGAGCPASASPSASSAELACWMSSHHESEHISRAWSPLRASRQLQRPDNTDSRSPHYVSPSIPEGPHLPLVVLLPARSRLQQPLISSER